MKLVSMVDAYTTGLRLFGEKPPVIAGNVEKDPTAMSEVLKRIKKSKVDVLLMGNIINQGDQSYDLISKVIERNIPCIRGKQEDIILQMLDAKDPDKVKMLGKVWERLGGRALVDCFFKAKARSNAEIIGAGRPCDFIQNIINGNITEHVLPEILEMLFGKDIIKWLKSLPVAVMSLNNYDPKKVNMVVLFTHSTIEGSIIINPLYITEEQLIWGEGPTDTVLRSSNIIYKIFGDKYPSEMLQEGKVIKLDSKTGNYITLPYYRAGVGPCNIKFVTDKAFDNTAIEGFKLPSLFSAYTTQFQDLGV